MIFPLKKQVPKIELCQEMKELDYPQDTLWYWEEVSNSLYYWRDKVQETHIFVDGKRTKCIYISAPTVAELGERLPDEIHIVNKKENSYYRLNCVKNTNNPSEWSCYYANLSINSLYSVFDNTEADARAKMWIYLRRKK